MARAVAGGFREGSNCQFQWRRLAVHTLKLQQQSHFPKGRCLRGRCWRPFDKSLAKNVLASLTFPLRTNTR
jgi:hypothetical protein